MDQEPKSAFNENHLVVSDYYKELIQIASRIRDENLAHFDNEDTNTNTNIFTKREIIKAYNKIIHLIMVDIITKENPSIMKIIQSEIDADAVRKQQKITMQVKEKEYQFLIRKRKNNIPDLKQDDYSSSTASVKKECPPNNQQEIPDLEDTE